MNKPIVTLIREALRLRLMESPELGFFVSSEPEGEPRIFLNFFEAWEEAELTVVGIYAVSERPLETDISPPPDERQLTINVEIITREDEAMEARLDLMAAIVEDYLTLNEIGRLIKDLGGPDSLLEIQWQGNERGYVAEAGRTLGANVMTFALDYKNPPPDEDWPDFLLAYTRWNSAGAQAEDLTEIPQGRKGAINDNDDKTP